MSIKHARKIGNPVQSALSAHLFEITVPNTVEVVATLQGLEVHQAVEEKYLSTLREEGLATVECLEVQLATHCKSEAFGKHFYQVYGTLQSALVPCSRNIIKKA